MHLLSSGSAAGSPATSLSRRLSDDSVGRSDRNLCLKILGQVSRTLDSTPASQQPTTTADHHTRVAARPPAPVHSAPSHHHHHPGQLNPSSRYYYHLLLTTTTTDYYYRPPRSRSLSLLVSRASATTPTPAPAPAPRPYPPSKSDTVSLSFVRLYVLVCTLLASQAYSIPFLTQIAPQHKQPAARFDAYPAQLRIPTCAHS